MESKPAFPGVENLNRPGRCHITNTYSDFHGLARQYDNLKPGDNICLLYDTRPGLFTSLAPFILSGLKNGHKCLYICKEEDFQYLSEHILSNYSVDISHFISTGQISVTNTASYYIPAGIFEPEKTVNKLLQETERALKEGYPCLRITGEMGWVFKNSSQTRTLIEYEAALNKIMLGDCRCIALCQYDINRFDGETLKGVLKTHPKLVWNNRLLDNCFFLLPSEFESKDRSDAELKHWLAHLEAEKDRQLKLAESEERYRALFQNIPLAIWEVDYSEAGKRFDLLRQRGITDFKKYFSTRYDELVECLYLGKSLGVNQAFLDIMEAPNEEEVMLALSNSFADRTMLSNAHRDTLIQLAEGKTSFSKTEDAITLTGTFKHFNTYVTVAPGCEQTLAKVYICFVDITELKKTTCELQQHKKYLEEIVKKRTDNLHEQINRRIEFTRALVHELKTPLTAIISSSEILNSEIKDENLLALANNIYKGGVNLNKRIDELLDMARSEIGTLDINRRLVDPFNLLNEIVEYLTPEVNKKGQSLSVETHGRLPAFSGDKDRLKQVFYNLISNAIKFNRKGGKIILGALPSDNGIIFKVCDEGRGIAASEIERLFQPYYRLDSDRGRFSGLGLGLALSKSLVELHHGRIWVNSTQGKGATFSFFIPLDLPEGSVDNVRQESTDH